MDRINMEDLEIDQLLELIFRKRDYDFRSYSRIHIKRRILQFIHKHEIESVSILQHMLLRNPGLFSLLLHEFSMNVTEMFRDPCFYMKILSEVVPRLGTYPFIKIWNAGCAGGEEVYSVSILLHEAGLLERSLIYATDFNADVLKQAKKGVYELSDIQNYNRNYHKAGGTESFSNYYYSDEKSAVINSFLKEKIVFAEHNLVSDSVFGEMQLILCRNVLIYFNEELQRRVLKLFEDSLCPGGFLCLGMKESVILSCIENSFRIFDPDMKIFRKKHASESAHV